MCVSSKKFLDVPMGGGGGGGRAPFPPPQKPYGKNWTQYFTQQNVFSDGCRLGRSLVSTFVVCMLFKKYNRKWLHDSMQVRGNEFRKLNIIEGRVEWFESHGFYFCLKYNPQQRFVYEVWSWKCFSSWTGYEDGPTISEMTIAKTRCFKRLRYWYFYVKRSGFVKVHY